MKGNAGMLSAACGLCIAAFAALAQASGIAQWDPRMALTADVVTNGVRSFSLGIDASSYVLDCLWNMSLKENADLPGRSVEGNYEKFIRNLRAKHPNVPIVMAEQCDVFMRRPNEKDTRRVQK